MGEENQQYAYSKTAKPQINRATSSVANVNESKIVFNPYNHYEKLPM